MRKALLVLASFAAVAFAGCASSSSNPWATPDSKPAPKAQPQASAVAPAAPAAQNDLFAEDAELPASAVRSASPAAPAASESDLLADFPAIRRANLEKALKALKAVSEVEELPMPDKGNARVTRYNTQVGVIEFITPNTYSVGEHVVLTKEGKSALVMVLAVDGNRIVADVVAGVKGAPVLKPADHVLCDVYRTPEEMAKIAAEQQRAQREALAAARAARQAEREALGEADDDGDDASADEEESDDSSDEEEGGDDGSDEDEEW